MAATAQAKRLFDGAVKALQDMTNTHVNDIDSMSSKHMEWLQSSMQGVWLTVTGESAMPPPVMGGSGCGGGSSSSATPVTAPAVADGFVTPAISTAAEAAAVMATPAKPHTKPSTVDVEPADVAVTVAGPATAVVAPVPVAEQPVPVVDVGEEVGAKRGRGGRVAKAPPANKRQGKGTGDCRHTSYDRAHSAGCNSTLGCAALTASRAAVGDCVAISINLPCVTVVAGVVACVGVVQQLAREGATRTHRMRLLPWLTTPHQPCPQPLSPAKSRRQPRQQQSQVLHPVTPL